MGSVTQDPVLFEMSIKATLFSLISLSPYLVIVLSFQMPPPSNPNPTNHPLTPTQPTTL